MQNKRIFLMLWIALCFPIVLFSISKQNAKQLSKAQQYIFNRDTTKASSTINKLVKKEPNAAEIWMVKAAFCEWQKDSTGLEESLLKCIELAETRKPEAQLRLANWYYLSGKYEQANQILENVTLKNASLGAEFFKLSKNVAFSLNAVKNSLAVKPTVFAEEVNTIYDNYWPRLSLDEQTIVTTVLVAEIDSKGTRYQEDFYTSTKTPEGWSKAVPFGMPLNTYDNEGSNAISPDGNYLFFTACNRVDGFGSCDIYVTRKLGKGWSVPTILQGDVSTRNWDGHPSLAGNGRELYFSSERPGGLGGRDIYKADLIFNPDGSVVGNNVRNLGRTINTPNDEISPFIHWDSQTLYFSSNGHLGLGRHDLYFTTTDNRGNWSPAQNIGYPVNTHKDEIGFSINAAGDLALFATDSKKPEKKGKDIYSLVLPKHARPLPVSYVRGQVTTSPEKKSAVEIQLLSFPSGRIINWLRVDPAKGFFTVVLPTDSIYTLYVAQPGSFFYSEQFSPKSKNNDEHFLREIHLKPIIQGETIVMENIFFDTDSFQLKIESQPQINQMVALLNNNPKLKIEIGGHTDSSGVAATNEILSHLRAKSVYQKLIDNKIAAARLSFKGYGSSMPLKPNSTPENRAINRRTEIKVMGN